MVNQNVALLYIIQILDNLYMYNDGKYMYIAE